MIVVRVVSVTSGDEVSRVTLTDDGAVTYSGSDTAASLVRLRGIDHGENEAQAIAVLARDGWSNGYLMVDLG